MKNKIRHLNIFFITLIEICGSHLGRHALEELGPIWLENNETPNEYKLLI